MAITVPSMRRAIAVSSSSLRQPNSNRTTFEVKTRSRGPEILRVFSPDNNGGAAAYARNGRSLLEAYELESWDDEWREESVLD
jgi:hypothetical protein